MNKNLQLRSALFLIAILVVPFTFYFAYQGFSIGFVGLDPFSSTIGYISSDSVSAYSSMAYLFVFFAFIVKRNVNLRVFLIYISALFELIMILDLSRTFLNERASILSTIKGVFYSSPGLAPLQAFNSVALILWTILIYQEKEWLVTKTKNLLSIFDSNREANGKRFEPLQNKFAILIFILTAIATVFSGVAAYSSYKESAKLFELGFNLGLLFIAINLLLTIPIAVLLVFTPLLFLFDTRKVWLSELHTLTDSLVDFKLSRYITRVVSGYLYWFYTISVIAILALTAPYVTVVNYLSWSANLDPGFKAQLALVIFGIPALTVLIGYFAILLIRIVFELAIALVHIAENSRNKN